MTKVDETALATLFEGARSQNGWLPEPVSDEELQRAYDIAKWGPTSMNTQPIRLLILRSVESKEKLKPALAVTNVDKVVTAPVVVLIAYDAEFYTNLPRVFPHNQKAQSYFVGNPAMIESTAFRNSSLQAAYFMIAARAIGLDVGPMSGFDPVKVNDLFFSDSSWRINMICGIGHGDLTKTFARSPRLSFSEVSGVI